MDLRAHFMKPALPLAQPPGTIMREPEAAQVLLRRWSVAYDFSLRAPRRAAVYVGSSQSSPHAAAGAGARPAALGLSVAPFSYEASDHPLVGD